VAKTELAADLRSGDDLGATGIYRIFVEQALGTAGGQPWGILAGLYAFDPGREDVELLGRIARIAQRAGAPFLAEGSCRLLGCQSPDQLPYPEDWQPPGPEEEQNWGALRQLPEASSLGLALPRLLLRLPYGKETSPVESFDFEEMPEGSAHEGYLWGSPAVACTYVLAEAFSRCGWDLRTGIVPEIAELPAHVYREDSENRVKPCAEVLLGERAVEAILGKGLMPLLSVRDRDTVRLARLQSLASPATPLAGRWS
jgi:type VI secretion system protein ImpC